MASKSEKIKVVYKKLADLKDTEYNPKKCTPKEENDIRNSIMEFGIVDPLLINTYEGRENIIIGGHQRKRIAIELGFEECPCIELCLAPDDEKELNLRLSKNTASIDEALLAINFSRELLLKVGFQESKLKNVMSDYEKKFNAIDDSNCAYPLVPKFSEKYDAVIIVSKNLIDTGFLETKLGIKKSQSYKNSRTGKAMVIDVEQFKEAWEKK